MRWYDDESFQDALVKLKDFMLFCVQRELGRNEQGLCSLVHDTSFDSSVYYENSLFQKY